MAIDWKFLYSGEKFSSSVISSPLGITYSSDIGTWDGLYGNLRYFDTSTKKTLIGGEDAYSAFSKAVETWDRVSSIISLSPINPGVHANINIYSADMSNTAAKPGYATAGGASRHLKISGAIYTEADIVINDQYFIDSKPGFLFSTAIHETGHALGLQHPNGNGFDLNFNSDMTIMSYVQPGFNKAKYGNPNVPIPQHWAVTPMPYDVWAIQNMYGLGAVNQENTVYQYINGGALVNTFDGTTRAWTIVDTGGAHDILDLSAAPGNQKIDLHEAIDGSGNWANAPTVINEKEYTYIAKGSVIENAKGSAGNDVIIGNDIKNELWGNEGNDHLYGEGGNDTLISGTATTWYDTLNGGVGDDSLVGTDALKQNGYGVYFFSNYGRDTIQIGAHTNANYVFVENFAGGGKAQSIIYTGGSDTATSATAAKVTIRDSNVQESVTDDKATVGATMYGANVIVHGFKTDQLVATLGPQDDTFVFASGHGSVDLDKGNDTLSLNVPKLSEVEIYGTFDNKDILYFGDTKISPGTGQTVTLKLLQHQTSAGTALDLWDAGHGVALALAGAGFRLIATDSEHFTSKIFNGKTVWDFRNNNVHVFSPGDGVKTNADGSILLPFGLKLESPNHDVFAYQHHSSDITETDTKWWIADSSPLV